MLCLRWGSLWMKSFERVTAANWLILTCRVINLSCRPNRVFFWLDCCCSTGASSIFIKHCSLKLSATFCCVMILFPGGNSLHTPHFFSLFICLSPSLPLCLLSCFLLFFVTIQLSLWQSLFSFPSFFHHSSALSPSIHPPYCLTGRVCCFYPSDIGSLPRACPETNEFSLIAPLGPAPSSASVFPCEITVHPAHTQALVGTHTHTPLNISSYHSV